MRIVQKGTTMQAAVKTADAKTAQDGHKALSQEDIDSFATNGYLRVGKVLDDDEIELLREEYDNTFALARAGKGTFRNLSVNEADDHDDHDDEDHDDEDHGSK